MQTYKFDADTREYLYSEEAFLDPLETQAQGKDVYLLPADSTFTAPLEPKPGHAVCWNGKKWAHVEDHRQARDMGGAVVEGTGTPYWLEGDTHETPARYMTELGPLPKGAKLEKPEKPEALVRKEALSRNDAATSAAILAGFEYEVEGEALHFSYDSFDQQNFADTANGCLLRQIGAGERLPESVKWNAYRNHTAEYKGDLVRFVLDVPAFLQLYTAGALAHKAEKMEIGGQRKEQLKAAETVEEIEALLEAWGI